MSLYLMKSILISCAIFIDSLVSITVYMIPFNGVILICIYCV